MSRACGVCRAHTGFKSPYTNHAPQCYICIFTLYRYYRIVRQPDEGAEWGSFSKHDLARHIMLSLFYMQKAHNSRTYSDYYALNYFRYRFLLAEKYLNACKLYANAEYLHCLTKFVN